MIHAAFPSWLTAVSAVSLVIALACAIFIAVDELKRPQKMWTMNIVWPLTALFGSLLWLAFYLKAGRGMIRPQRAEMERKGEKIGDTPMPIALAKGASGTVS